jgi:hypothetical protein
MGDATDSIEKIDTPDDRCDEFLSIKWARQASLLHEFLIGFETGDQSSDATKLGNVLESEGDRSPVNLGILIKRSRPAEAT